LEEALQKFVTPEILRNENAYKCSKCKKSVQAKKQFTVHRAPNVATFQFKRFDCSRMFGKITKPVSYTEKLNLRPYMSEKVKFFSKNPILFLLLFYFRVRLFFINLSQFSFTWAHPQTLAIIIVMFAIQIIVGT